MKKILFVIFAFVLFIPVTLFADEKVKVYMFESGGCPYCEAEMEYLKGLKGYKKTFTVERMELYIDHIDWEPGKDYDLGVKVADEFNRMGFEDASYQGTPFVVISDIYAAASYSEDLEEYINQALEEGDRDAVSCIKKGKSDCVRMNENARDIAGDVAEANEKAGMVIAILAVVVLAGIVVYVIKNKNKDLKEEDFGESGEFDDDELEEETEEVKPKTRPRKTTKKTNKK